MPENQQANSMLFHLYSALWETFIKMNRRSKQGWTAVKVQRERGWVSKSPSHRPQYNPQRLLIQSTARKLASWPGRIVLLPSFVLYVSKLNQESIYNQYNFSESPIYILTIHKALARTVEVPRGKLTEEVPKLILRKCKTTAASASLSCLLFSTRDVPEESQGLKLVDLAPLPSLTADYFAVIATVDVFKTGRLHQKTDGYFMLPVCFHCSVTYCIISQTGNDYWLWLGEERSWKALGSAVGSAAKAMSSLKR